MNKEVFGFGKNWLNYFDTVTDNKIKVAMESMTSFLNVKDFTDKTFFDIGSGSGIFSCAAHKLGAKKIMSIDIDPESIECTRKFFDLEGKPESWSIRKGSILDKKFTEELLNKGKFDIVYSWGVLHHTGKMWDAIKVAASFVKENGLFYIAIYNKVEGLKGSKLWLKLKIMYNNYPKFGRFVIEPICIFYFFIKKIINRENPFVYIKTYEKNRGMSWRHDIIDWLGGYPYEFATADEIISFVQKNYPNFKVLRLKKANDLCSNDFVFVNNTSFLQHQLDHANVDH